ncbi:MAG: DNA-directed RNA polymerase subunit omega [Nevskia sp.]|nr:DNA-directed RNA polymerase subunit omega [Nevskia sp.]
MAREILEDCLTRFPNQFELVLIAVKRARQLARGSEAHLPWGNHKSTVLSLQEIAGRHVSREVMAEPDPPAMTQPGIRTELLPGLDDMSNDAGAPAYSKSAWRRP